jgi:hypothetical protein
LTYKKRLAWAAAAVLLVGGGGLFFLWPREAPGDKQIRTQAETAVRSKLRDPASANFGRTAVIGTSNARTVCGNVNVKNTAGGYTGFLAFIYDEQTQRIDIASNASEAADILSSCMKAEAKHLEEGLARLDQTKR